MPLTLTNLTAEADLLVPNAFSDAQKVVWLNEVNNRFFDIVKIPKTERFGAAAGAPDYILTGTDIRAKNIDLVMVGSMRYTSILSGPAQPGRATWDFDESARRLTLTPEPIDDDTGTVRYFRIATTTFLSTGTPGMNANPDAPPEYHWIYVLGLCERMAKAQNDIGLANNYATDFNAALTVAAQNFQKGM